MAGLGRELRIGFRLLRRAPAASAVAIVAIGLGAGANAAIFSIANGLLLHPLPFPNARQLMYLAEVAPRQPPTDLSNVSAFDYLAWREQAHGFTGMTAYQYAGMNLSGSGTPAMVQGAQVMPDFYDVIGVRPVRGRAFLPEEGEPGREREVVLSQALWERQFQADPGIVGRTIELNQEAYTVVGVMGKAGVFPPGVDLWMPLALTPAQRADRGTHTLHVVGKLRAGVPAQRALAELRGIAARLSAAYPDTNRGWGVNLITLTERVIGNETASYVYLLFGATGFLLLVACANVANLQFARALSREQELAVRSALGAGRARIVRQLLGENLALGVCGAVAGLAAAAVSIALIRAFMPADVAVFIGGWERVRLDWPVALFTLAAALAASLLSAVAPAWHAARPDLGLALKDTGRGAIGPARRHVRTALVSVQIALALALMVGAVMMAGGLHAQLAVGSAWQPDSLLTAQTFLPSDGRYTASSARAVFWTQALERLGAVPGIAAAGTCSFLPFGNDVSFFPFSIEGQPVSDASRRRTAVRQSVSADFFALLHIPLLSGRAFTASDSATAPPVAIISRRLAQLYWPRGNALGQHVKYGDDNADAPWLTVIGVAPEMKWAFGDTNPEPTIYRPAAQDPQYSQYFLLRAAGGGDPTRFAADARRAVAAIDARQPLFNVMSLEESMHEAHVGLSYVSVMLGVAALLALVLAATGVYGVMSYFVGERVREFGIRRALGAMHGDIVTLVLRRAGVMFAWGFALGLPLAWLLARALESLILGVGMSRAGTFAGVCLLLAFMGAVACLVPARFAMRVDPATALRE